MKLFYLLLFFGFSFTPAFAQSPIQINSTQPCFESGSGWDVIENCGFEDDFIAFALYPWEWITGGFFTIIVVTILIIMTYLKYHKASYPLIMGVLYFPVVGYLYPDQFLTVAFILSGVYIGIAIWYAFIKQTKEY